MNFKILCILTFANPTIKMVNRKLIFLEPFATFGDLQNHLTRVFIIRMNCLGRHILRPGLVFIQIMKILSSSDGYIFTMPVPTYFISHNLLRFDSICGTYMLPSSNTYLGYKFFRLDLNLWGVKLSLIHYIWGKKRSWYEYSFRVPVHFGAENTSGSRA